MRKYVILIGLVGTVTFLSNCHGTKKATASVPKTTYETDIQPLVMANCSPCHIPPKGNKEPFNTYEAVTKHIDSMIARIELHPDQKGFMPFKKKQRLSDSTIAVFKKFRDDGMPAK